MHYRAKRRRIIIGDVHGELERFCEILAQAGLINGQTDWIGGSSLLVQTGDVIDRGPKSRESVEVLRKLQRQAAFNGGDVVRLCGNHELMLLQGYIRYANFSDPEGFANDLRQEIAKGVVLAAWTDGARLYTHAGLRSRVREFLMQEMRAAGTHLDPSGIDLFRLTDHINAVFKQSVSIDKFQHHPIFHVGRERGGSDPVGGIFWCDFSTLKPSEEAWLIRQVFGHTPWGGSDLATARGLRLINVDAGMCSAYGGQTVYLEITQEGCLLQQSKTPAGWQTKSLGDEPVNHFNPAAQSNLDPERRSSFSQPKTGHGSRYGLFTKDNRLYYADKYSAYILQIKPGIAAWEKSPADQKWKRARKVRLELRHLSLGVLHRDPITEMDRSYWRMVRWEPSDSEFSFEPKWHRSVSLDEWERNGEWVQLLEKFISSIPPRLLALIKRFPTGSWELLEAASEWEGFEDLMRTNPALAVCVAMKVRVGAKPGVRRKRLDYGSLPRLRQREIAAAIGFEDSEAVAGILKKISPDACTPRNLKALAEILTDPANRRNLQDASQISGPALHILSDPFLTGKIGGGLIAELSQKFPLSDEVTSAAEGVRLLRGGSQLDQFMEVYLGLRDLVRFNPTLVVHSLEQFRSKHDAMIKKLNTGTVSGQEMILPDPPFPGTEHIQPITSVRELSREGREMHHCVKSYLNQIFSGFAAVYRVTYPERATLSIERGPGYWRFGQLKLESNGEPAEETVRYIQFWLKENKVRGGWGIGVPEGHGRADAEVPFRCVSEDEARLAGLRSKIEVKWRAVREMDRLPDGHGLVFVYRSGEPDEHRIGFLEGFAWLHETPETVFAYHVEQDQQIGASVIDAMRADVTRLLETGELKEMLSPGRRGSQLKINDDIDLWING